MTTIPDELVIAGIARAALEFFNAPDVRASLVNRIADLQSEPMTTAQAAAMLGVHPKTLLKNHVEWRLDKSVALGPDEPRFFRSQIMARLKDEKKVIKGREPEKKAGESVSAEGEARRAA